MRKIRPTQFRCAALQLRAVRNFWCAALIGVAMTTAVAPARAAYPDRPVIGIIPFAPGGATDLLARIYANYLGQALGQSVVPENKPGANGTIGIAVTAHAKSDGYTILFSSTASTESPALYRKLNYDPLKDLVPVATLAEGPLVIVINTDKVKAANLLDFIALLKANPGKYFASAGGSGTRLSVELFALSNGLDVKVVPYDSAGAATTALLSGESMFSIVDAASLAPLLSGGKVRILAVAADKRLAAYPDIPTTQEAGLPNYTDVGTFAAYVKSGTPQDIIKTLSTKLAASANDPKVLAQLRTLGWNVAPSRSVDESGKWYRDEIAKWKDIVVKAKIPTLN